MTENEIKKLLQNTQGIFHLIYNFGKNKNITNFVNV